MLLRETRNQTCQQGHTSHTADDNADDCTSRANCVIVQHTLIVRTNVVVFVLWARCDASAIPYEGRLIRADIDTGAIPSERRLIRADIDTGAIPSERRLIRADIDTGAIPSERRLIRADIDARCIESKRALARRNTHQSL